MWLAGGGSFRLRLHSGLRQCGGRFAASFFRHGWSRAHKQGEIFE